IHLVHEQPIRSVGIVGAGAMGAGIAQLAATRGFQVSVREISPQAADVGRRRIESLIQGYAKHKRWDDARTDGLLRRVDVSAAGDALDDCDLVVEAIVEKLEAKQSLFADLADRTNADTILASNTSSLSIAKIASTVQPKSRCAGLHFFNPVNRMELVEVVRGPDTDAATTARLVSFVRALGKTPVVTRDAPGFLVNRILFPYLGEAVVMVQEGLGVAEIDRQLRRFGMPMGPLQLLDHVGLDVAASVAESLQPVMPEAGRVVETLSKLLDRGELGVK
ncbi:MAG: 3-hydroxyacyl-CoA dehydrogenase family protein, partial [Planctomycetota bacterium]